MDSARVARLDSARAARGDTARRRAPDSLRMKRLDSLRAAGALDSARRGRAGAPGRGGPGMPGRGRGDMLGGARGALAGINLNDNEKAAVKTITEKYREEMKQLRDANGKVARGQNAQLRQQMEDINKREEAEIRAALTAEHQAQFDANVAKRPARGVGAPPPGRRPPQPVRGA